MADHCRGCTTLGHGPCDCADLLARQASYDAVAKALLSSALGERWMGMEDITEPWRPRRLRGLEAEPKDAQSHEQTLIRELADLKERITTITKQIAAEFPEESSGG